MKSIKKFIKNSYVLYKIDKRFKITRLKDHDKYGICVVTQIINDYSIIYYNYNAKRGYDTRFGSWNYNMNILYNQYINFLKKKFLIE